MEFTNDLSKLKQSAWDSIKTNIILYLFALITAFINLYFSMINANIENIGFILGLTFSMGTIACLASIFTLYKKHIKKHKEFVVDIQEDYILDKKNNIEIKLDDNFGIAKDKDENYFIKNGKSELFVSKYLNNKDEFESFFARRYKIGEKSKLDFSKAIGILSCVFFCGLYIVRFTKSIELYLFMGTGFVLTAVYSTINMIIHVKRKPVIVIAVLIELIFIFFISRNVYYAVLYLMNK
jgi:hypothetical protein